MMVYARVVFKTNASVAERHVDVEAARCWIEAERVARSGSFRFGQIAKGAPDCEIVETFDLKGWTTAP